MTDKAFIFDLNGTMVDDMEFHAKAWFGILNNDLNANLGWDEVRREMYGKNQELLVRVFGEGKFSMEEMDAFSMEKERRYQAAFKEHLRLINGLEDFLKSSSEKGIALAIGSAAIMFNIDFVLDGLNIRHYFSAIVSADDVQTSKPDPETFLKAAEQLGIGPKSCIVFEDAPKGVEAALNAGMQTVVLTTMHPKEEFAAYSNIICFIEDYTDDNLKTLFQ